MQKPTNFPNIISKSVRPWLTSLIIVVLFFAALYLFVGQPSYETNDDVLMAMTVAGCGFSETPDPHMIYSNFLIGIVLSQLFKWQAHIPWYGLYLIGSQIIALTVIVRVLSKKFTSKLALPLVLLALFSSLRPILIVQFTTTSSLLAIAAGIMLFYAIEHCRNKRLVLRYSLGSILLFSYASMIRWQSVILIIILLVILLAVQLIRRFSFRRAKVAAMVFAVTSVSVFALNYLNGIFYKMEPEWHNLYTHCKASWQLINSDRLLARDARTIEALDSAGWSSTDIELFYSWFFRAPQYQDSTLEELDRKLPRLNPYFNINHFTEKLEMIFKDISLLPTYVVIIFSCFWLGSVRMPLLHSISMIAAILALSSALMFLIKCPVRVYSSMFQLVALILLLYSSPGALRTTLKARLTNGILLLVIGFLFCTTILSYSHFEKSLIEKRIELKSFTNELSKEKGALTIFWGGRFPYELVGVLEDLHLYFGNLRLLGFNSLLDSPTFESRVQEFGISNVLKQLDKKNILLVVSNTTRLCLAEYMAEHLQLRPKFIPVVHNKKLDLTGYGVEFSTDLTRSDTEQSPLSPIPDPSDLVLFQGNSVSLPGVKSKFLDLKPTGNGSFEVTGTQPMICLNLDNYYLRTKEYSHLYVELAVDKTIADNRQLFLWLKDYNKYGHALLSRLLPDSKEHRYFFKLSDSFDDTDVLTQVNINPLYIQSLLDSKIIKIGRVGLIRKNDPETMQLK